MLMSPEMRNALTEALRHATLDESLLSELVRPAEALNVTFSNEDKLLGSRHHERPLYMICRIDGTKCNKVLIDPGSSISIMSLRTLRNISLDVEHLVRSPINIQGFNAKTQTSLGAITLPIEMGGFRMEVKFHVINSDTTYKALLGRPWLHEYGIVPSTLHQCIKFMYKGVEHKIDGDISPFQEGETHCADAKYYMDDCNRRQKHPPSVTWGEGPGRGSMCVPRSDGRVPLRDSAYQVIILLTVTQRVRGCLLFSVAGYRSP